jgi:hypothetical protein
MVYPFLVVDGLSKHREEYAHSNKTKTTPTLVTVTLTLTVTAFRQTACVFADTGGYNI